MPIRIRCGACGKVLSVRDELAGKRVKCPCGNLLVATASPAAPGAGRSPGSAAPRPAAARPAAPRSAVPRTASPGSPGRGTAPAAAARTNPYAAGGDDLSDLFDELTDSDLQSRREREQAATAAQEAAVDPLAAYQSTGKGGKRQKGGSRPLGVTILAVLNFLVPVIAIPMAILFLVGSQTLDERLEGLDTLQNVTTLVSVLILVGGLFYAAVGAGLLSRQPWGWWLAAVVYSYNFCNQAFYSVLTLIEGDAAADSAKQVVASLFAAAILAYFFKENVRNHFKMKVKPAVAAAITIGSTAIFSLLLIFVLHLMAGDTPVE